MCNIDDKNLGGQLKPVHNNFELRKAMYGRKNCVIYTVGIFRIEKENLEELKERNIKLVALAFAQAQFKPRKTKQITSPLNIALDELHELPYVTIGIDISDQKDRYVSGSMR